MLRNAQLLMAFVLRFMCVLHDSVAVAEEAAGSNSTTLKIGYLYPFTPAAYAIESWSLFQLAIAEINADPNILPSHTLSFAAENSRRADGKVEETKSLSGSIARFNPI